MHSRPGKGKPSLRIPAWKKFRAGPGWHALSPRRACRSCRLRTPFEDSGRATHRLAATLISVEQLAGQLPQVIAPLGATLEQADETLGDAAEAEVSAGQSTGHRRERVGVAAE